MSSSGGRAGSRPTGPVRRGRATVCGCLASHGSSTSTARALAAEVADLRARAGRDRPRDIGAPDLRPTCAQRTWSWCGSTTRSPPDLATALADPAVRCVLAGPTLTDGDPDRVLGEAAGLLIGGDHPGARRPRPGRDATPPSRCAQRPPAPRRRATTATTTIVTDRVLLVDKVTDDVQVLLTARVGLIDQPVLTWRPATSTAAWTLGAHPGRGRGPRRHPRRWSQLLATGVRLPSRRPSASASSATAPSGTSTAERSARCGPRPRRGVRHLRGASLRSSRCRSRRRHDRLGRRARRARRRRPGRGLHPAEHPCAWALRAIDAGKHVVVEKPFAIHTAEADAGARRGGRRRPARRGLPEPPLRPGPPGGSAPRPLGCAGRGLPHRDLRRRLRPPLQPLALRRGRVRRRLLRLGLAPARPDPRPRALPTSTT